jgi:hypothetical protein
MSGEGITSGPNWEHTAGNTSTTAVTVSTTSPKWSHDGSFMTVTNPRQTFGQSGQMDCSTHLPKTFDNKFNNQSKRLQVTKKLVLRKPSAAAKLPMSYDSDQITQVTGKFLGTHASPVVYGQMANRVHAQTPQGYPDEYVAKSGTWGSYCKKKSLAN